MANTRESIRSAYDKAAAAYGETYANELDGKPFDRLLLDWLAASMPAGGKLLELGCGPGHIGAYLAARSVSVEGIDLSPAMVVEARRRFPGIQFSVGDMTALAAPDGGFAAAIAWYAIVNLELPDIRRCFAEVLRVLQAGGRFLLAFHAFDGQEWFELDEFFLPGNRLDFRFHRVEEIKAIALEVGFAVVDIVVRQPYEGREHPSQRAYFVLEKPAGAPAGRG
jgi:ubiquinone/menaquinone biosynthesis C-methylase UbiE